MFDFTAITNCRSPQFVGGAYSLFITLSTPFVCLLFGWMYLEQVNESSTKETFSYVFSPEQVYGLIGGLGALQILTFFFFLGLISTYRRTFTSFTTMPQLVQEEFSTFTEPDLKIKIFERHKDMWAPLFEEVRKWLNDSKNLDTWIKEKPEWFNDHVKASILDEFVENPSLLKEMRGAKVQEIMKRRKSFG